jgi:ankyrin repeat protein
MKNGQYQQKRTELPHRIPHSDSEVPYEKLLRLGPRYFGAIRRNDIKAVKAMTEKSVVLSVKDEDGRTPLEYAKELERDELIAIIEAAIPKQKRP